MNVVTAFGEIELARALLAGGEGAARSVRSHSLRAACWLARVALEQTVVDLLEARGVEVQSATMRSKLCALEVLYRQVDPTIAQRAQYAWDRLSNASHYHAFELSPSLAEVRGLVDTVTDLAHRGRTLPTASGTSRTG